MHEAILAINAGSSNLKFALFSATNKLERLCFGKLENLEKIPRLQVFNGQGKQITVLPMPGGPALVFLLTWIKEQLPDIALKAVGHRVVHGGRIFTRPVVIDNKIMERLETLIPLAPLHMPEEIENLRIMTERYPFLPQVACFDTAFHHTQPKPATMFALPYAYGQEGIMRYGFHGLSYEYIASVLPEYIGDRADRRVVVAHLGNGASMCAMQEGKSIATSMGFTALDGLMMGTRCGAIDPGVILYLLEEKKLSVKELTRLLYKESGLLGVSGISHDVRVLLESGDPKAQEAVDLFCYRAVRELGALVAVLQGLDALVFTGGIGEHQPEIRDRICKMAEWLGVRLDEKANQMQASRISDGDSAVTVSVIPTDEERMIAQHVLVCLS